MNHSVKWRKGADYSEGSSGSLEDVFFGRQCILLAAYMHTYTHTYIQADTHTYTHIYVHTYLPTFTSSCSRVRKMIKWRPEPPKKEPENESFELNTYYLLEQSSFWEANSLSASQEITYVLWNPKLHYRIQKPPATCSCTEPDQSRPCPHSTSWRSILILSSHLLLGLPSGPFPSGLATKPTVHLFCQISDSRVQKYHLRKF